MKTIQAYTIIEIAVALAISAISISMMYKGKLFFEKLLWRHQRVESGILTANMLDRSIRKDFLLSQSVLFENNMLLFNYPNDSIVYYQAQEEVVLKYSENRVDSFLVIGELIVLQAINNSVKEMQLTLLMNEQKQKFKYRKDYSPYVKYNLKLH